MTKNSPDDRRSKELAAEVTRLVEQHREEYQKKHGTKPSLREIERDLDLEHPALSNIMKGKNNLLGDRSKWSLFKIGIYLGTDFGEKWLSDYINQRKTTKAGGRIQNDASSRIFPSGEEISKIFREYGPKEVEELLKLLNSIKPLPPEERIKKFEEWRRQGHLNDNLGHVSRTRRVEVNVLDEANLPASKPQLRDASSLAPRRKKK